MYDTVVIGNDISSIAAALTAQRNGKKTLLLSEGYVPDSYSEAGYTFDIDPFPWTGLGPDGIARKLLSDMHFPLTDRSHAYPMEPALQIITSNHRLELFSDPELQCAELDREFGIGTEHIRKFYESIKTNGSIIAELIRKKPQIHPRTFPEYVASCAKMPYMAWRRKRMAHLFEKIADNPSLVSAIDAVTLVLTNLRLTPPLPLSFAYALSLAPRRYYYHRGGKHRLLNRLRQAIKSHGGTCVKGCSILRIDTGRQLKVDLVIDGEAETLKARDLIISAKWEKLTPMLFADRQFARVARNFSRVTPSHYPFTVHMGLREEGLPEKMSEYVILIPDEPSEMLREKFVFLETSAHMDTERAPVGKRALSATMFLKESPLSLSDEKLKEISKVTLHNVIEFLPFLPENLETLNIDKSIEISRTCQEMMNRRYTMAGRSILGIAPLPHTTSHKHVFLTGGSMLAGLGFEGEVISGINAANTIIGER